MIIKRIENKMTNITNNKLLYSYICILMKVPINLKKPELKSCHNTTWEDNYSWIHQDNILEVLKIVPNYILMLENI